MKHHTKNQFKFWGIRFLILLLLLIMPLLAGCRLSEFINGRIILGSALFISLITLCLYWIDKRKAQKNLWRVSELVLHALSLCGGWAGAYFSQQVFRHKNRKLKFQLVFWIIVLLHQIIAFEIISERLLIRELLKTT